MRLALSSRVREPRIQTTSMFAASTCSRRSSALILLFAANTSFNGFPRLLSIMARNGHAPRLFLRLGDRLAFSNGTIALEILEDLPDAATVLVPYGGGGLACGIAAGVRAAWTEAAPAAGRA